MKKMTGKMLLLAVLFGCALFACSRQDNEPVYINSFLTGIYACEFAENGIANEELKAAEPARCFGYVEQGNIWPHFR